MLARYRLHLYLMIIKLINQIKRWDKGNGLNS